MSVLSGPLARGLCILVAAAAVAGAQEPPVCEVDEGRPNQVARALLAVQVASSSENPAEVSKQLTNAMKQLTENPDRISNQPGRNMVLGKALVLWAMQPNVQMITNRGAIGYASDPAGTVDLAFAIDSAFGVVEAAFPACVSETSKWRGQKPWVDLVNSAIQLTALNPDSAEIEARRVITLNPHAPYGYVILGQVLQGKDKGSEALAMYRQGVEVAARDTIYADVRRQSLLYLANLNADSAEAAADAAARRPYMDAAYAAYNEVAADPASGTLASNARAGLCRVAIAAGDTANLRQTYKGPIESPATHSYLDLMNAGVCLARAEMIDVATVVFRGAYEKNPWHRDALSNLAIMLIQSGRHVEALPFTGRLVAVEPNSEENLQLAAMAYAGKAKQANDARAAQTRTKAAAGQRVIDSLFAVQKAYNDSAVTVMTRKDSLAYVVSVTEFNIGAQNVVMSGIVRNQGKAAKPITVKVDFLDAQGSVVQTQQEDLGVIAAGESGRFSLTAPAANVVAFRYSRIE